MKRQRGSSIAEVLTVTVIIGMLLSAMVVIVPMLVKAPVQMQSQVDEVNTAAIALYKMRRDFSEGDARGIMACQTTPVVSCSAPTTGPLPTPVQALAVATAEDSSGGFQIDTLGNPEWQGFYVYWLVPNSSGTAYDLMRAWEGIPTTSPNTIYSPTNNGVPVNVNAANVNPLVTAAMAISPPPVLSNYITSMDLGEVGATSTINFELLAGTSGGVDQTQTTFLSNTYARN